MPISGVDLTINMLSIVQGQSDVTLKSINVGLCDLKHIHRGLVCCVSCKLGIRRDSDETLEMQFEDCDWTYTSIDSGWKVRQTISNHLTVGSRSVQMLIRVSRKTVRFVYR